MVLEFFPWGPGKVLDFFASKRAGTLFIVLKESPIFDHGIGL